jgi:hypothetical protein
MIISPGFRQWLERQGIDPETTPHRKLWRLQFDFEDEELGVDIKELMETTLASHRGAS